MPGPIHPKDSVWEFGYSLNVLAGSLDPNGHKQFDDALAANIWAGTKNFDLLGALNRKAGTTNLDLNNVCNVLLQQGKPGSPTKLEAQRALSILAGGL